MNKISVHSKTFAETSEYPTKTDYSVPDVATTSPEYLSINQSWTRKAGSKRTSIVTLRKVLPYANNKGAMVNETIILSVRLSHIADRLADDKASTIKELFSTLVSFIGDDSVQQSLIAGEHNLSLTIK